jgi:heme exporter protein B
MPIILPGIYYFMNSLDEYKNFFPAFLFHVTSYWVVFLFFANQLSYYFCFHFIFLFTGPGMVRKVIRVNRNLIYIICLFVIMLSLSSFALEKHSEQEVMLTLIWICATFVLQISTSNLFASDYHDGVLEQIFIQPFSSKFTVTYKIFAHWLLFGLPISLISSIFSLIVLGNNVKNSVAIGLSLLFNTLIIINISAAGNSLMIGRSNLASGISQILVLPMIMPTFIYFKLLIQLEHLFINVHILLITTLIFTILITTSTIASHMALKFAIEYD